MQEGRVTQEQLPRRTNAAYAGDRQGCRKLEQCRSNCRDAQKRPTILLHFHHCTWTCRCREAHDSMARVVPNYPSAFPPSMAVRCRKLGQRRSSCRNSGRGAVVGAVAGVEPRRATCKAEIVPNNPSAFPPSLAVRCRKLGQRRERLPS